MTRLCQNCIMSSITLFKIILQYFEEGICKSVEFNEAPTADFLRSIFMQLETIISQVRILIKLRFSSSLNM